MKTLVLTSRPPTSRVSGYDLRVANLCRLTPGELHLAIIALEDGTADDVAEQATGEFESVQRMTHLLSGSPSPRRHARLSDSRFLQLSRPEAFERLRRELSAMVGERGIDRVVAFGGDLAEVAIALGHPHSVLDICDSVSLTRRRNYEVLPPTGVRDRLKDRLDLARARSGEARMPQHFRYVTTISEPDSQEIRDLAGSASNVVTIPNGVDEAFLDGMVPSGHGRGVAFWGNLQFGPNQVALRYFLDEVYRPHLREAGLRVGIFGPNAPPWLEQAAAADEQLELAGFVPDLREAVAGFPIMINPMRTGSGLKNKVLEAFGLGLPVVTTTRGIEALSPVRAGVHVRVADDASSFAQAVLELVDDEAERARLRSAAHALLRTDYTWSVVGRSWRSLFDDPALPGRTE